VTFGDVVKHLRGFPVTADPAIGDPAIREGLMAISPNPDELKHLRQMKLVLFEGSGKNRDHWVIMRQPKGSFLKAILDSVMPELPMPEKGGSSRIPKLPIPKKGGSKPNVLDHLFLSGNSVKIRKPKERPQELECSYPIQSRQDLIKTAYTKAGEERLRLAMEFGLLQTHEACFRNPREEAVEQMYFFEAKSDGIQSAQLVKWQDMIEIDPTKLTKEEKKKISEFRDKHIKKIGNGLAYGCS